MERTKKTSERELKFIIIVCIYFNRARGYPDPVVTWRREDGNEIILKDSMGTKTPGKNFLISFLFYFYFPLWRFLLTRVLKLLSSGLIFFSLFTVTSFRGEVLKLTKIARNEMGSYLWVVYAINFYIQQGMEKFYNYF